MEAEPSIFPVLQTERLVLRETGFSDIEEIYFLRSDAEVNKYLGGGSCENRETAKAHITLVQEQFAWGKTFNWSICLKPSGRMIGSICLWNISRKKNTAEIGYTLHPLHQHQGYMNESMKAVLDFGFREKQYRLIDAYTDRDNSKSVKLLLKNGFVLDESKTDVEVPTNRIYALTREKWLLKNDLSD
ncbi:MAG: GNAT family N-acetyltransferase [Verrucomicrobiales bacterium]|nr:GNAT family N-acetyltransferase [Verrucomicrobiales bacterium]